MSNNKITNLWMPKTVEILNLSNNPIVLPHHDHKQSLFVRMAAEVSHARWIRNIDASFLKLYEIPKAFCLFKGIVRLNLSHNSITVSLAFYCSLILLYIVCRPGQVV